MSFKHSNSIALCCCLCLFFSLTLSLETGWKRNVDVFTAIACVVAHSWLAVVELPTDLVYIYLCILLLPLGFYAGAILNGLRQCQATASRCHVAMHLSGIVLNLWFYTQLSAMRSSAVA